MKYEKLNKDAKKVMLFSTLIKYLLLWIAIIVIYFFNKDLFNNYYFIGGIILLVISISHTFVAPFIKYRRYKYLINEEMIDIIEGFFFQKRNIIPIERVKQITIKKNPIESIYKISRVIITTSGGSANIKYLKDDIANQIAIDLKNKINDLVKYGEVNEKENI